jgi:hypothetical protein
MKKLLFVVAVLLAGYFYFSCQHNATPNNASIAAQSESPGKSNALIANTFSNQLPAAQNRGSDKSDEVIANAFANQSTAAQSRSSVKSDEVIANAFANQISNLQVTGQGIVIKVLPDDNSGSGHQKFIIKLTNGQTLLVAHNIDITTRVNGLSEGDSIMFSGQYEWNEKGGVLHWTHRDSNGSHPSGWLQYQGQTYQ